ncbi:MAG: c-type cytochrome [Kofleriaceae bacterium]
MRTELAVVVALAACSTTATAPEPVTAPAEPVAWSDAWLDREGTRFRSDDAYRRAALEQSLVNPKNLYSRQRLLSYGLGTGGWDKLPVWNPRSLPVTAALAATLERGELPAAPVQPLWDGKEPATMAGWVALGKRVFFEYPMRAEVFMEWGLTKPALAAAIGVERTAAGDVPGLVVFRDVDAEIRVGITCAICHSAVKAGVLVPGSARRSFDYGRLRVAYFAETGAWVEPGLAKRMAQWGPGRADVTEDDDEDPVTIPDLWGLRSQAHLTQAGTIRHASPLALAIRQETQLTDSNHAMIRPPRALAWALAMYVYSLAPPPRAAPASPAGAALFATHCAGCHANAAYGGRPIAVATIGTNPALATSRGRGTGTYRVPPLLAVAAGAPYLHDGSVASLQELLSPERLAPGYRSRFGGPIPGHTAGTNLGAADRGALIAYLETL